MPQKAYFPPIHFICAHGAWHDRRRPQQPATGCLPPTRISTFPSLPRSSFLTALAAPSWLKCPLFAIVDVPPSVAHKDSFFTVYHCRSTHLRARRPSAARSFPRSRNGTSRLGLRGKERRRRRSGGSGGTYSWSVRPSVVRRRRRLELARRQWREGERGAGNGHCLQAPRAATDLGAVNRRTDRPTSRPSCLSHSSPSPSHEKENTRSWKVGRTDGRRRSEGRAEWRQREGERGEKE